MSLATRYKTGERPVVMGAHEEGVEVVGQRRAELSGVYDPFFDWAMKVPEPKRGILNFNQFPYQRELYSRENAEAAEVVVMKATQTGVSAWLLRWVMYLADVRGLTALYIFPKRQQMYDFADARIKAAILASPYLRARIGGQDVQNKGLKKIGLGYLYCRGSESRDDLQTIDADGLAMDEYDDLRPENIPDAERRLSGSVIGPNRTGLLRRVGVPDFPGRGLDALYEETDKRRWFVKCSRCGERQPLTYAANVDEEKVMLVCRKCEKGPLDVSEGEWVAEQPERDVHGYHLSRLIVPHQNLQILIDRHHKTDPTEKKAHYCKDLGIAYADDEGRISLDRIQAAQREDIELEAPGPEGEFRTMGVDVATVRSLNVRVSGYTSDGRKRSLYLGTVDQFGELGALMKRYEVQMCLIDHLPEGRLARAFAEEYPGRVFLVNYGPPTQKQVMNIDPDMRTVSVRRLEAIDATLDAIRRQENLLPAELPDGYVENLQNVVRTKTEDEHGRIKVGYRSMGPDDWLQAETYDLCAHDAFVAVKAIDAGIEGETMPMEERYEFERTALGFEDGDDEYGAGPGDDDKYRGGFGE